MKKLLFIIILFLVSCGPSVKDVEYETEIFFRKMGRNITSVEVNLIKLDRNRYFGTVIIKEGYDEGKIYSLELPVEVFTSDGKKYIIKY